MLKCKLMGDCWILNQLLKCSIDPPGHAKVVAEVRESGDLLTALENAGIPPLYRIMMSDIVLKARKAPLGKCGTCGTLGGKNTRKTRSK